MSEVEQVLQLNGLVRKQRKEVKVRYFTYARQAPPPGIDQLINDMGLELPAVFIEGKPAFQGGLPTVDELIEAIDELVTF